MEKSLISKKEKSIVDKVNINKDFSTSLNKKKG